MIPSFKLEELHTKLLYDSLSSTEAKAYIARFVSLFDPIPLETKKIIWSNYTLLLFSDSSPAIYLANNKTDDWFQVTQSSPVKIGRLLLELSLKKSDSYARTFNLHTLNSPGREIQFYVPRVRSHDRSITIPIRFLREQDAKKIKDLVDIFYTRESGVVRYAIPMNHPKVDFAKILIRWEKV